MEVARRFSHLRFAVPMLTLVALGYLATEARAQETIKPGTKITPQNAELVKDRVSPGVYWRVRNGMLMTIVPTGQIDWPPPYREATEKYSGQVRLAPNHTSLQGYVAGQPFPLIDPNDPDAAVKIIWNVMFRPMWTDDFDARYFGCVEVMRALGNPTRKSITSSSGITALITRSDAQKWIPCRSIPISSNPTSCFGCARSRGFLRKICAARVSSGIAMGVPASPTTPGRIRRKPADCAGSTKRSWAMPPARCSSTPMTPRVTIRKWRTTNIDFSANARC